MADRVFKLASATLTIDEKVYDLAKFTGPELVMPAVEETEPYAHVFSVPITITWVGEMRFYPRRQLMLDLARYTRWPYTN